MFSASGDRGLVYVHTSIALVLGHWSLDTSDQLGERSIVRATVLQADAFWATQVPDRLALDMGQAQWIWADIILRSTDPLVCVVVGDPIVQVK